MSAVQSSHGAHAARPCGWWLVLAGLAGSGVAQARIPLAIRGPATVLMRAEPGTLRVRIEKRDLNIYDGADVLVARLTGPGRSLVDHNGRNPRDRGFSRGKLGAGWPNVALRGQPVTTNGQHSDEK